MKGIHNIYICAAILCLFLCYAGNAWGQTNGNQYEDVGGNSEISVSLEDYSSETTGYRNNHYARYAIDNYNTTYWLSDENRGDNPWLILQIGSDNAFKQLQIRSESLNHRPQRVTIEASNSSNNGWTTIGTYTTNFSNDIATITLTEAVNQSYIRLTFERNNNYQVRIYDLAFYSESEGVAIQHKPAKWFDMREGNNYVDTFNDELKMITSGDGKTQIQAAHTYVDTLYVKKGTPVELWLPTISRSKSQNSVQKYQRWYNYLTEGTFSTGNTESNQVQDLLTPEVGDYTDVTAYRFTNGYVGGYGLMGSSNIMYGATFYYPRDNQFNGINNGEAGNDYYVVACDISGYTDFTEEFESGNGGNFSSGYIEPTLSLRVIYYIVGIGDNWANSYPNDYQRLHTETAYQGGTNADDKRYLEEYEINFPSWHIGNFTDELVSLAREAQHYRIPGDANSTLNVSFAEGGNTFSFLDDVYDGNEVTNKTLSSDQRIISFRKTGAGKKSPWYVDNGTTATILVTKTVGTTTYNIARYKLTFRDNIRLLTQHQISRLDNARTNAQALADLRREDWYKASYLYRTPEYLEENYILLTSRTFDYDKDVVDYGQQHSGSYWYYPYPLDWSFSSYAFFDGSTTRDFDGSTKNNDSYDKQPFVEWGSYAITDNYVGYGDLVKNSQKKPTDEALGGRNADGYFLYVDASNRPGQLVTLPFTEKLCAGSELLISAWVKSAGTPEATADGNDAAMLFTIYGVDGQGNRTPIYCQSTSQIRTTSALGYGDGEEYTNQNGYGSNQNDWYHVFFSFINNDPNVANYESYELKVNNNCASTGGGDFYLDEVKVYIAKPLAQVQQLKTACSTERTLMNLQIDWERLMARVGDTGTERNLALCFVDTLTFHNTYDGTNFTEALEVSAVDLGMDPQNSYQFRALTYNTTFGENKTYDPDKENLASANGDAFYGRTNQGEAQALSVDFYSALIPGRAYWIIMVPDPANVTTEGSIHMVDPDVFAGFNTDPCAIKADFKVTGNATIKLDGQIADTQTNFCKGNIGNFTVELQVPRGDNSGNQNDTVTIPANEAYFDWFFGLSTEEGKTADPLSQYLEEDEDGLSLQQALTIFRNIDPDATTLDSNLVGQRDEDSNEFTQEMYDLINRYLTAEIPEGAQNRPLVLHEPALNITLLDTMRVVICTIPLSVSEEIMAELGYNEESWRGNLCWGYQYLELTTTESAPQLHAGFNTLIYPDDLMDRQALRIGLEQIESVSTTGNNYLTIDLRGAKSHQENNRDFKLQLIENNWGTDLEYNKIYLTDTDDPDMKDYVDKYIIDEDLLGGNRNLPIGIIHDLEAHFYQESSTTNNKMKIQFNLGEQTLLIEGEEVKFQFKPKEGYYYTFTVYFEEEERQGSRTACYGHFPLTMKVVPEYLVWNDTQKGDGEIEIGNWNNDANWKRATNGELQKSGDEDSYPTEGNTSGFVPMLFSKVIIPRDSKIHLYTGGFTDNLWSEGLPDNVGTPTENIQYDLMTYEHTSETAGEAGVNTGDLKTERYRVALCDQIHFEPGAEMLHAEYLLYDKAWVDYELDGSRWYTLASPLQGVVAGDFYAPTFGRQETEYFQPITFDTDKGYNRFNPSVYQRAWKDSDATLQTLNHKTKEMAISGNWSSLYNDVDEAYTPGTGFSLKVQDLNSTSALFRLPKADGEYYYFNYNNGSPTQGTDVSTIDRGEDEEGNSLSGRLMSDKIYHRTETETSYTGSVKHEEITVPLSESANGDYYLVGNPFMAHLDMEAFFAENGGENGVLEDKYWYVADDGVQNIAVTDPNGENTSWTDTENAGLIPPLHSFFVKKKDNTGTDATVTFTADMQTLATETDGTNTSALILTAQTADGKTSRAAIAYDATAKATYETSEDAELFLDSNLSDVPTIYTVAGTMATSINRTSELYNIPVGIYGNSTETVTLSVEGLKNFSSATLYDAEKRTETPLREGTTITLPANTSGRYFLRAGAPTANEQIATDAIQIYTLSGNRVMVTSTTPLKDIRVYTISGALVKQAKAGFCSHELYLPEDGIYVISAKSANGATQTAKVAVN